jgi:hypothetical protein
MKATIRKKIFWRLILRFTQKSEWALRNQMHILLFVKKTIFHHLSQRHRVVGVTKLLTKISSVKNYLEYVIFKFMGPFYRVLNICSWGQLIILLWKSLKLDLGKSRLLFFCMQTELYFSCISYSSLRAKTPLNTSLYVFQIFKIIFNWKKITEKHDFSSVLAILGKNYKKIFSKFTYYRSHRSF